MTQGAQPTDRVLELFSDLALQGGLGADDQRELQALLSARTAAGVVAPQRDAVALEIAAAAVTLACAEKRFAPMPDALAARIEASFFAARAPQQPGQPGPAAVYAPPEQQRPAEVVPLRPRPRGDALRWAGWVAAAACFFIALYGFWRTEKLQVALLEAQKKQVEPPKPTPAEARAALLARDKSAVPLPWKSTEDPDAKGAGGDVVWSGAAQEGYMRIKGLAANDPAKAQYQLWIFDEAQDERHPVDGGVFDVDPATGEVVVPIRAKLGVKKPTLFAITVEKPGGVTVSKRERIVLVAKPG